MNLANHYPTFLSSETGSDYFRIKGLWRCKLFILFFFNRGVLLIWRSSIYPCFMFSAHPIWGCWKRHDSAVFQVFDSCWSRRNTFYLSQKKSLHKGEQLLFILAKKYWLKTKKLFWFTNSILSIWNFICIYLHMKKIFKFANYHIFFSYFNLTQAILHSLTKSGVIIGN